MAFSPDGKTLASASHDRTVRLWNVATGELIRSLEGHAWGGLFVAFSPGGKTLASGSVDRTVRLWNVATGGQAGLRKQAHGPRFSLPTPESIDTLPRMRTTNRRSVSWLLQDHSCFRPAADRS